MTGKLLTDALDCAFKASFQRLFDVLISASVEDETAFDRFHTGFDKIITRYDEVRTLIKEKQ